MWLYARFFLSLFVSLSPRFCLLLSLSFYPFIFFCLSILSSFSFNAFVLPRLTIFLLDYFRKILIFHLVDKYFGQYIDLARLLPSTYARRSRSPFPSPLSREATCRCAPFCVADSRNIGMPSKRKRKRSKSKAARGAASSSSNREINHSWLYCIVLMSFFSGSEWIEKEVES